MQLLRMQAEVKTPMEEVVHDVPNTDHENHCIFINHFELDDNSQQEFGIGDYGETLNRTEGITNPIDVVDVDVNVEIDLTTNMKLNYILN